MSCAVVAAPFAQSVRATTTPAWLCRAKGGNTSTSITTARQRQLTTRQLSTSRALRAFKPEEHSPWRRDSVSALNRQTRQDPLVVPHNPKPNSKGGLITPECYAPRPEYLPILLDPLPPSSLDEDKGAVRNLDSLRPPPLETPTKQAGQSRISYYLAIGKAYLKFYKTALRQVHSNWRDYRQLRGWIHPFTIVAAARYGGQEWTTKKPVMDPITGEKSTSNKIPVPNIFRRDFQLYYRTISDVRKLIPFCLVLVVCGELTPLAVALFGNSIVPFPCRIPAQQRQAMNTSLRHFRLWKEEMGKLTAHSVPKPAHAFDFNTARLEHPWRRDMLFGYLVGQSRFARPLLRLTGSLYFHAVLRSRLEKYWERIFCDTILIRREGGFAALSPMDVFEYALNYGSLSLLVIMDHEIRVRKNYDFINDSLKEKLVPVLEREADAMFQDDFTRLMPHVHWMRAYRNTALWRDSPDVLAAVELLKTHPPRPEPVW